ncbi:MAG: dihydroorotase [Planctomycetota bacterium]
MSDLLIEKGRVIDPASSTDHIADVLIREGRIVEIGHAIEVASRDTLRCIDATNCIVAPGLVDLAAEFREPGHESDETMASGSAAALAGGYTTVLCCSSTDPKMDSAASVQLVRQLADDVNGVRVHPIACLSKQRRGEQMAELGILAQAGAVAFSDSPRPMPNDALLKRALDYCRMFDLPIFDRPEVPGLAEGGVMHNGCVGLRLGLRGLPTEAEDLAVARDVRLAEATSGRLHIGPVSTMGAIDMIGRVKERGIQITASVCPHNLTGSDVDLCSFDSRFKVHPPLRSPRHVDAVRQALAAGVIDAVESGHMPRAWEKKSNDLDQAPFGAATLETTLSIMVTDLINPGELSWSRAIECLSTAPATIAGINGGRLQVGQPADVVVINPSATWTVNADQFASQCRSSPADGRTLTGRATHTIVGGHVKFSRQP